MPYGDGKRVTVTNPTGGAMFEIDRMQQTGNTNVEEMLRLIAGDAADELLALVRTGPAQAMNEIVQDIMQHFGFGGSGPVGGDDEGKDNTTVS